MPADVATNLFANYGVLGLVVVGFFFLVWWVLKTSTDREEKLYKIIDTLSKELPEIRSTLEDIKEKLFK